MSPEAKGALGGLGMGLLVDAIVIAMNKGEIQDDLLALIIIPVFLVLAGAIAGGATRK